MPTPIRLNTTGYKNKVLKKLCISEKIAREFTVPEALEQHCDAEPFNRTIVETTNAFK